MTTVLSTRALNRTLLARQHLLRRCDWTVPRMAEHLVGLQAQDVLPPFIGLWSRIDGFEPDAVSRGLEDRSLARVTIMRGTIHLTTAADALRIRPLCQPGFANQVLRPGFFYGAMAGMTLEELVEAGEQAFGEEPVSPAELRGRAEQRWPDRPAAPILQSWYYLLPVLQVPPRGKWKDNSRPVWSRAEPWLRAPLDHHYPAEELVWRYLAAFGPASTADIATWSRLTGIKELVERLGARVRTYRDDAGKTLYDVADGVITAADVEAPVRFLGWYDNVYLSHKDRSRIGDPAVAAEVWGTQDRNMSPVLVDGFIGGGYKVVTTKDTATMRVKLAKRYAGDQAAVAAEAGKLLAFMEAERTPEVTFVDTL